MYVTPDFAHFMSTLNSSDFVTGYQQVQNLVTSFNEILENSSQMNNETRELLKVVISSTKSKMNYIDDTSNKFELKRKRVKRDMNPLYLVGDVADWTFGLVSHDHLEEVKTNVEKSLTFIGKQNQKIHDSILSNSEAINNSVATLQKFETFLNLLVDNNDSLLKSERLMLKIVRLKFEIDACIKSLESFSNILLEIVDRSNIGYPSHYLFTRDFLTSNLLVLNDKFPDLSPMYNSESIDKYFKLPLAVTSVKEGKISSILRIPMVSQDAIFPESTEKYQNGFVILSNLEYFIYLTFSQYENCISDSRGQETVCYLRPCLIRSANHDNLKCFAITQTDFLFSGTSSKIQTMCNGVINELTTDDINGYGHISVPTHCQLVTKQFIIKPVNVFPSATTDVTQLNKIFKVEEDHVVLQNDDHLDDKPKHLSLKVSSNAILAEINKTKAQLDSSNSIHDFQIEDHFGPLSITGTTLGSVSVLLVLIFILIFCRHL